MHSPHREMVWNPILFDVEEGGGIRNVRCPPSLLLTPARRLRRRSAAYSMRSTYVCVQALVDRVFGCRDRHVSDKQGSSAAWPRTKRKQNAPVAVRDCR